MTINVRRVTARFAEWPAETSQALRERMEVLTARLLDAARSRAPDRTGALRSSIVSQVTVQNARIEGVVTVNADFAKAGALEYGGPGRGGRFMVSAYVRTVRAAFGRSIPARRVSVAAYSRMTHLRAEDFLRGALADVGPEASRQLQQVMDDQAERF